MDDKTNQQLKHQRMMIVVRTFLRYDIFKLLKLVNSKSMPLERRSYLIHCWEQHWQKVELEVGRKRARLQLERDMEKYAKCLITRNRRYLEDLESKNKNYYDHEQNRNTQNNHGVHDISREENSLGEGYLQKEYTNSGKYDSIVHKILNELKDDFLQLDSQLSDTQFQQDRPPSQASPDYKHFLQEYDDEQMEEDETEDETTFFSTVHRVDEFFAQIIQEQDENDTEEKPITFDTDTPASPDDVHFPIKSPSALTDEENFNNEEEYWKETASEYYLNYPSHISSPYSSVEVQPGHNEYSNKQSDDESRKEVKSECEYLSPSSPSYLTTRSEEKPFNPQDLATPELNIGERNASFHIADYKKTSTRTAKIPKEITSSEEHSRIKGKWMVQESNLSDNHEINSLKNSANIVSNSLELSEQPVKNYFVADHSENNRKGIEDNPDAMLNSTFSTVVSHEIPFDNKQNRSNRKKNKSRKIRNDFDVSSNSLRPPSPPTRHPSCRKIRNSRKRKTGKNRLASTSDLTSPTAMEISSKVVQNKNFSKSRRSSEYNCNDKSSPLIRSPNPIRTTNSEQNQNIKKQKVTHDHPSTIANPIAATTVTMEIPSNVEQNRNNIQKTFGDNLDTVSKQWDSFKISRVESTSQARKERCRSKKLSSQQKIVADVIHRSRGPEFTRHVVLEPSIPTSYRRRLTSTGPHQEINKIPHSSTKSTYLPQSLRRRDRFHSRSYFSHRTMPYTLQRDTYHLNSSSYQSEYGLRPQSFTENCFQFFSKTARQRDYLHDANNYGYSSNEPAFRFPQSNVSQSIRFSPPNACFRNGQTLLRSNYVAENGNTKYEAFLRRKGFGDTRYDSNREPMEFIPRHIKQEIIDEQNVHTSFYMFPGRYTDIPGLENEGMPPYFSLSRDAEDPISQDVYPIPIKHQGTSPSQPDGYMWKTKQVLANRRADNEWNLKVRQEQVDNIHSDLWSVSKNGNSPLESPQASVSDMDRNRINNERRDSGKRHCKNFYRYGVAHNSPHDQSAERHVRDSRIMKPRILKERNSCTFRIPFGDIICEDMNREREKGKNRDNNDVDDKKNKDEDEHHRIEKLPRCLKKLLAKYQWATFIPYGPPVH